MPDPIAMYGAVVGTAAAFGAVWSIYDGIRRGSSRLKVTGSHERTAIMSINDSTIHNAVVTVRVINVGHRVVTVDEAGVVVDGPLRLSFVGPFPSAVTVEKPFSVESADDSVWELVAEARAPYPYCRDVEGNVYEGRFSTRIPHQHEVAEDHETR